MNRQNTFSAHNGHQVIEQPSLSNIEVGLWTSHHAASGTSITLSEVVHQICNPDSATQALIDQIRSKFLEAGGGDSGKAAIRDDKARLACITFSALGTRKQPTSGTGLLCVDIDQLGQDYNRAHAALARDPHVVLGPFRSPSGDGLKAVFKVPMPTGTSAEMRHIHRRSFVAVKNYCHDQHRIEIDPAASDLMRLCYLSVDPACSLNEQAMELDVERWQRGEESPEQQSDDPSVLQTGDTQSTVDPEVVMSLLLSIPSRPDYSTWLKISAAVRNTLGSDELAIELLKEWSPEEDEGEYAVLLRSSSFSHIGFGTLFHHARKHGFWGVKGLFYYSGKGSYAMQSGDGFIPLSGDWQVKEHLRKFHVRENHKGTECHLCDIRSHNYVNYIGEIAGYPPGLHTFEGSKLLVTRGPNIIPAAQGDGSFIHAFVRTLLVREGDETQLHAFLAWLQLARRALLRGQRVQIPALAIVGGSGDGKSLLIHIINQCLGGREANAYRYLSGSTNFNADLIRAELLCCDDQAASKDHRSRLRLAQNTKNLLFATSVRVEPKGKDAFNCAPIQALVLAANDDPQHLRVLPELDETMRDKITILRSYPSPLPPEIAGKKELIQPRVLEAVPGFVHDLEEEDYSAHYDFATGRLLCHWNEEAVAALGALSPETTLLELIHSADVITERIRETGYWVGTAADLEAVLFDNMRTRIAAQRILTFTTACGVFLSRLAEMPNSGISKAGLTAATRLQLYRIEHPCHSMTEEESELSATFS